MVQFYAEILCRWGIATLAYDKRGTGDSTAENWDVSFDVLADDAVAAVDSLRHHPQIDPDNVGLLGGSQAGWIMPLAAVRSTHVAFLVMLAGPAVTIAEQNVHNVLYNLHARGLSEPDVEEAVAHVRLFNHVLTTGEDWDAFQQSLEQGRRSAWAEYAWSLDAPPTHEEAASIREEAERDPVDILQQVRCPVLAVFGGSDTVVPPAENVPRLAEAVKRANISNYTIEVIPAAKHTFLKSPTGADAHIPNVTHMDLEHLAIVQRWLHNHVHAR
jgi:pimeloyl-ACP methyl ester carboxylesterase